MALRQAGCSGIQTTKLDKIKNFSHQVRGLSHRLLKNIDGIRNLGNIGAHETSDPNQATLRADKEQTSWNVTVWERLLEEWYVRPTQDAAQVSRLQDAGLKVRQPKG